MRRKNQILFVVLSTIACLSTSYAGYDSEVMSEGSGGILILGIFSWLCDQNWKAGLCALAGFIGGIGLIGQIRYPSLIYVIIYAVMLLSGIFGYKKYEHDE